MADKDDRTEAPSPRRRDEARRQGQVAISPEIAPVTVLMAGLVIAGWGLPRLIERTILVFRAWLTAIGPMAAHDDAPAPLMVRATLQIVSLLGPFLVGMAAVGASAVIAQIGFLVTPELLMPKASRISPATGLQRMFSAQGAANLVKASLKIALLGFVAYRVIHGMVDRAVVTPLMALPEIMALTGADLRRLLWWMLCTLGALALADAVWQRRQHEQSLRMSRQELKDESKQSEGDPAMKGRFRRAARELGKRRMLTEVGKADVILTNPIHVAVAIRYRATEGGAPRVLAKGAGELAQKIKEAARQAGVPIVERRALARALYKSVEIGQEVPPALYRAVAEILAYIYSLRRRTATEAR